MMSSSKKKSPALAEMVIAMGRKASRVTPPEEDMDDDEQAEDPRRGAFRALAKALRTDDIDRGLEAFDHLCELPSDDEEEEGEEEM